MPTRTNRTDRAARAVATVAVSLLAATSLAACGGKGSEGSSTTTSVASTGQATTTSKAAGGSSTTASTTSTTASSTTTSAPALPGASTAPHSAPAKGGGVALLRAVRVGRNQGYERIVFEFAGDTVPGYQVAWVEPPITADGSGETPLTDFRRVLRDLDPDLVARLERKGLRIVRNYSGQAGGSAAAPGAGLASTGLDAPVAVVAIGVILSVMGGMLVRRRRVES